MRVTADVWALSTGPDAPHRPRVASCHLTDAFCARLHAVAHPSHGTDEENVTGLRSFFYLFLATTCTTTERNGAIVLITDALRYYYGMLHQEADKCQVALLYTGEVESRNAGIDLCSFMPQKGQSGTEAPHKSSNPSL